MNNDITSDFQQLFEAAKELPLFQEHRFRQQRICFYVVANYIMQAGWKSINQAKELTTLSSLYYEEIKSIAHPVVNSIPFCLFNDR